MIKKLFKGFIYFLGICALISILAAACEDEEAASYVETDQGTIMVIPEDPDSEVQIVEPEVQQPQFESIVLTDNELVTVTITEFYEDDMWNEVGFEVEIVNKTNMTLMVSMDDVSVNGVMNDPFWAEEVAPGKVAYSNVGWYVNGESNKNVKSLADLNNIEFTLNAYDSNDIFDGVRIEEYINVSR